MIGKIVGAMIGKRVAERTRGGLDSTGGAVLGALAIPAARMVARRLGPIGLAAVALGAFAASRMGGGKGKR